MSKVALRAFAGGMFVTTSVFTYLYLFHTDSITATDMETTPLLEEVDISSQVDLHLKKENLVGIDKSEYEQLQKAKVELSKVQHQLHDLEKKKKEENEEKNIVHQGSLIVHQGMRSSEVAAQLEELNVVESKEEFQRYLENHGLTKSIRVGQYNITSDMSFKEIADTILKK